MSKATADQIIRGLQLKERLQWSGLRKHQAVARAPADKIHDALEDYHEE